MPNIEEIRADVREECRAGCPGQKYGSGNVEILFRTLCCVTVGFVWSSTFEGGSFQRTKIVSGARYRI